MPKAGYTSYSEEKFHSVFATRLREELAPTAEDAKNLADYLGITVQAVNQYKQGQGFPKTENLVKIAQHYHVSLDYLIGTSDVKNPDASIQGICEYTGLSEAAIEVLHNMNSEYRTALMPLFEDPSIEAVGGYIAFALWSVIHADTSDRKPWNLPGGDDISFFEDGSIRLSSKEAAKSHIDRATRHIGKILESSIINAWDHPELYMEGDSNAKESKQESER